MQKALQPIFISTPCAGNRTFQQQCLFSTASTLHLLSQQRQGLYCMAGSTAGFSEQWYSISVTTSWYVLSAQRHGVNKKLDILYK